MAGKKIAIILAVLRGLGCSAASQPSSHALQPKSNLSAAASALILPFTPGPLLVHEEESIPSAEKTRQLVDPITNPAAQEESPGDDSSLEERNVRRDALFNEHVDPKNATTSINPNKLALPLFIRFEGPGVFQVSTPYEALWFGTSALNLHNSSSLTTFAWSSLFVRAAVLLGYPPAEVPLLFNVTGAIAEHGARLKQMLLAGDLGESEHDTHTTDANMGHLGEVSDYEATKVRGVTIKSGAQALQLAERVLYPERKLDVNKLDVIATACEFVQAGVFFKWAFDSNSEGLKLTCTITELAAKYRNALGAYPHGKDTVIDPSAFLKSATKLVPGEVTKVVPGQVIEVVQGNVTKLKSE